MSQRAPEVIDEIGLARLANVIEDDACLLWVVYCQKVALPSPCLSRCSGSDAQVIAGPAESPRGIDLVAFAIQPPMIG